MRVLKEQKAATTGPPLTKSDEIALEDTDGASSSLGVTNSASPGASFPSGPENVSGWGKTKTDVPPPLGDWMLPVSQSVGRVTNLMDKGLQGEHCVGGMRVVSLFDLGLQS